MGRSGEIWPLGDWVPPDPGSTFRINRQEEDRSEVRRKEGGREGRKRGRADFERRKFLGWKGFLRFSRDSAATKQKWKRNEREREKGFLNRVQRRGFWSRWKISNRSSRSSWGEWRSSARLPCILWLGHGGEDHPFDIYIFTCIYMNTRRHRSVLDTWMLRRIWRRHEANLAHEGNNVTPRGNSPRRF